APGVQLAGAAGPGRDAIGGAQHERVELRASGRAVLLRVVEVGERPAGGQRKPLEGEEAGGGHERARERASTRLVGAGDEAPLERAIEGEELAAASFGARPRAFRCGLVASR